VKKLCRLAILLLAAAAVSGCVGMTASAEECYSIGMAYFELGKYEEAENWLNRAKAADKTMTASQYNLGRLAYERKRYGEAAAIFEDILTKDPNNILALKAAAYARIKTGDINTAERYYSKLLELVPESADDGYNHALVLYAMGRYDDAEKVLERNTFSLLENSDIQLLYARSQSAQNKAEAIDSYAKWLNNNTDAKVRYEYAQVLEYNEFYARALDEYRKALSEVSKQDGALKNEINFALAKLLLTADSESGEGIIELQNAVKEGFNDIAAVEKLLDNENISAVNVESIRNIIDSMRRTGETKNEEQKTETQTEIQDEDQDTNTEDSRDE